MHSPGSPGSPVSPGSPDSPTSPTSPTGNDAPFMRDKQAEKRAHQEALKKKEEKKKLKEAQDKAIQERRQREKEEAEAAERVEAQRIIEEKVVMTLQKLRDGVLKLKDLHGLDPDVLAAKSFAYGGVEITDLCLEYVPEEMLSDWDVMLRAIKFSTNACRWAHPSLLEDKSFVMKALAVESSIAGFVLESTTMELRGDREVVLAALESSGGALEFASEALRHDREVVLKAVRRYGLALEHASQELRADRDVVLQAISSNCAALRYASSQLKEDRAFLLEGLRRGGGGMLQHIHESLQADPDFLREAMKIECTALSHAAKELQDTPELVLEAIIAGRANGGAALELAPLRLREDRQFLLQAAKLTSQALRIAPDSLRSDKSFVLEAVKCRGAALQFALDHFRSDRTIVLEAVKQDLGALTFAPAELRNDYEFMSEIAKQQRPIATD
eukprot:TRINITY_DN18180_c0_g2_i2.p1 TRINITY_DN18180_c0_g2~~TRINITY_DN18180_c0_g2_i2.p1  ORF type:complete len:445 (+),score=87.50 TRINITY_DN18180_c0_g2_i2:258-1592(+)